VTTSFASELDGLEGRGNILVIGATNRRDALDPAIARPGRLGDLIMEIPRPGMAGAAGIFDKHLPEGIPYAGSVDDDAVRRRAAIDAVASQLYAPNGMGEVVTVTFRDGTRRGLTTRDVISGANIANIARSAIERACVRDIEGGEIGVQVGDLLDAARDEIDAAVTALTPASCHLYLSGLPQDLGVVRSSPWRGRFGGRIASSTRRKGVSGCRDGQDHERFVSYTGARDARRSDAGRQDRGR